MHPHADPSVIMWWVRHPHSIAIQDDTYYGDGCDITERGKKQLLWLGKEIERLQPDRILCSPALRSVKVIQESDRHLCNHLELEPAVGEWPRATEMQGKPNESQEVIDYLEARLVRLLTSAEPLPGEQSFSQVDDLMRKISLDLIALGAITKNRHKRPARIIIQSHGNRGRQFHAWALADGDEEKFKFLFELFYRKIGIDPTGIMPPLWFGRFFRGGELGWNSDWGSTRHLPRNLRDSAI